MNARFDAGVLWRRALRREDAASLAAFRVLFGVLMLASTARFVAKGWVEELYLAPTFHFTYWPLSFVAPPPGAWLYVVFAIMGVAALGIALGAFYRASAIVFFLIFTYVELLDVSTYLNHYYLVSLLALLLVFVPAHRAMSVDAYWLARRDARRRDDGSPSEPRPEGTPAFVLWLLRGQVGLVYAFAGIAKLDADWLFRAQPLATWLPVHTDLPIVGSSMDEMWLAYVMSWAGAVFDLTAFPLLCIRRTRPWAYAGVVVFHLATGMLFRIGVFPFVMIAVTTIFFDPSWPRRVLSGLGRADAPTRIPVDAAGAQHARGFALLALAFLLVQGLVPLRQHLYAGNRLWTEQGYRFAWNVMLMEKTGVVTFDVHDPATEARWSVNPRAELTPLQVKMLATQPDLILQYAHHIATDFARRGHTGVEVRADAWASLNGRRSQRLIDPGIDLAQREDGIGPRDWIVPLLTDVGDSSDVVASTQRARSP